MVWTLRWRGAEGLPTRAAFSIFLSIFFLRAGAFKFILTPHRSKNALVGGWLLFAFIGTGSSFRFAALAATSD